MDLRAVLILLCMLCTQAPCRPANSNEKLLLQEIQKALTHLGDPQFLPNTSCSLNITELVGLKQQPPSHCLPSIGCYMEKLSEVTPELSANLMTGAQFIQAQLFNSTAHQNCTIPAFEQQLDGYVFAKCFLQLVEKKLSKFKLMKTSGCFL